METLGTNHYSIRASSFGELFDCALRWKAKYIMGIRSPNSPRALIGSGVHAGSAVFDLGRVNETRVTVDEAVGVALDEIRERIKLEGVHWTSADPTAREVEATALRLTTTYCQTISPRYDFEAVELTTKPLTIEVDGLSITLTGTLDRARIRKAGHGITDLKTGKAAVSQGRANTRKHRAQIGTYELLYEHSTGNAITAPSEVLGINTGTQFDWGTADVVGAKALLLGPDGAPGLIELAANMFRTGLFPPNPQSTLCDARYCPYYARCAYSEK